MNANGREFTGPILGSPLRHPKQRT
jgi:hypothetical protein